MRNKKVIIIALLVVIIIAVGVIIIKPFYDSKKFEDMEREELIEYLENIKDVTQKQNKIKEAIEKNWITEQQANEIR